MVDFHGGYGVTLFGYKHQYLNEAAISALNGIGCLSSLPIEILIECSTTLAARYKLPYWRFMNSGTEATLDAIRLARGAHDNKRPYIIKIESGYHGHHDGVWVSVHAGARELPNNTIPSTPFCSGIPEKVYDLTLIAEYNNIDSIESIIRRYPDQIAGLIVEPVLLNCSMIKPKNGFLQKLLILCKLHGIIVIFDLVKLNTAVSVENITSFWNSNEISPHMYTLGKGLSGGMCPVGAVGMTAELATLIETKKVQFAGKCIFFDYLFFILLHICCICC
jgi:glutamate-1-semialdehyde 2,1-aminomutase